MQDDICKKNCFKKCLESADSVSKQLQQCMECEYCSQKVCIVSKIDYTTYQKKRNMYAGMRTKSGSYKKTELKLAMLEHIRKTDPYYYAGLKEEFMETYRQSADEKELEILNNIDEGE